MALKDNTTKPKFKKCAVCDNRFQLFRSTAKVCSTNCAIELSRINAAKKEKKQQQANRKDLRDFNRQDVRWQHKQTQPVFNRMRVLEELQWFKDQRLVPRCISCQNVLGGDQWCCGHFKTVGSAGRLRYDRKNTYLQHNFSCNMNKSGDIEGYKNGLINDSRFLSKEGMLIIRYCEQNTHAKKWTWQEVEEMRKGFNLRIRQLESEQ